MNKYLVKIASNAMARQLTDKKKVNLSTSVGNSMEAMNAAGAKAVNKFTAGGGDAHFSGHAQGQAFKNSQNLSSSSLVKSVSSGGTDRLATTSIKDRLAEHKSNLGLTNANGDKVKQIENANALRQAKGSGKIGGELSQRGSGMAGSANAQAMNKAMLDAKAGYRAHLSVDSISHAASATSTAPKVTQAVSAAKSGIFEKAKGLLKSPLGRKVAIGGALLGAGAVAHKAMSTPDTNGYQY